MKSKIFLTFASMEIRMTVADAWRHFLDNLPTMERLEKNEVRQAQRDAKRGLLTETRMVRLMEKYGQGRYRVDTQMVVLVG